MVIERIGKTTGRWPKYELIVDGVGVGQVSRSLGVGCDRMLGRAQQKWDGWRISGLVVETRDEAEQELIRRAVRFGHIKEA